MDQDSSYRYHSKVIQIFWDYVRGHSRLYERSLFEYILMYNRLPQSLVEATSVKCFQARLTHLAKERAKRDEPNWRQSYENCRDITNFFYSWLGGFYFQLVSLGYCILVPHPFLGMWSSGLRSGGGVLDIRCIILDDKICWLYIIVHPRLVLVTWIQALRRGGSLMPFMWPSSLSFLFVLWLLFCEVLAEFLGLMLPISEIVICT